VGGRELSRRPFSLRRLRASVENNCAAARQPTISHLNAPSNLQLAVAAQVPLGNGIKRSPGDEPGPKYVEVMAALG
jgi:hypothetical protein